MRIVFFGTPSFAAYILRFLIDKKVDIAAVITRPDKPQRRSNTPIASPVKLVAAEHAIPIYQPQKVSDPAFADFLRTLNADFFVVAAFAEIFKENVLEIPSLGCINVHASLLPKYRGAAPIQRCIMAGDKESGVTIMKMAKELDAGDILEMVKIPIPDEMTAGELTDALSQIGATALWSALQKVEANQISPHKQNPAEVTYAKKLTPEDGEINWRGTCDEIYNHIRGVTPKPGAWCSVILRGEEKRLLIKKASKEPSKGGRPADIVSEHPLELLVGCAVGSIRLLEVQLEGKKTLPIETFLRGVPLSFLKLKN